MSEEFIYTPDAVRLFVSVKSRLPPECDAVLVFRKEAGLSPWFRVAWREGDRWWVWDDYNDQRLPLSGPEPEWWAPLTYSVGRRVK